MNRTRVQDVQVGESTSRVFSTSGPSTAGPAPTFILLHGIGMSHRYLTRLQAALSGVGDTHSIDLPGFGANPRPSGPLSVESFATIAGRVLDHLGIASAIVIGHSMGTQFAIELARQRPALVSHVVLMGPVVDSRRRTVWQQALALARDSLREPPSVNFTVFIDYSRCGPRWYLTELTAMMDYPTEDRIQDVGAPVLVVRGADDPIAGPEWCRMLAVKAGRGTFVEIPRTRHVVQQSAPGRVASVILAFVNGSTASPGEASS